MKIKTKQLSYEEVMALPREKHRNPLKPLWLLQLVVRVLAIFDLLPTRFTYKTHGMEQIGKKEPCLILMNHSSFIDLKNFDPYGTGPDAWGVMWTNQETFGMYMEAVNEYGRQIEVK